MKRDGDLIRKILLKVEEKDDTEADRTFDVDGYTHEEVNYQLRLLDEAHLIDFLVIPTLEKRLWPQALTWAGHDFLDAIRNDSVWSKTKNTVKKAGSVTFEILKFLAGEYLKEKLGISPD